MTTSTTRPFRTAAVTLAIALASLVATDASASTLIPAVDMGGSGGGGGAATQVDFPTANERSIQLAESKNAPGGALAGAPYEAPQATSPNQATF